MAFDGTHESEYAIPPLTVVRQRVREMAEAAVRTVVDRSGTVNHQVFAMDLIVRRSCGCS